MEVRHCDVAPGFLTIEVLCWGEVWRGEYCGFRVSFGRACDRCEVVAVASEYDCQGQQRGFPSSDIRKENAIVMVGGVTRTRQIWGKTNGRRIYAQMYQSVLVWCIVEIPFWLRPWPARASKCNGFIEADHPHRPNPDSCDFPCIGPVSQGLFVYARQFMYLSDCSHIFHSEFLHRLAIYPSTNPISSDAGTHHQRAFTRSFCHVRFISLPWRNGVRIVWRKFP